MLVVQKNQQHYEQVYPLYEEYGKSSEQKKPKKENNYRLEKALLSISISFVAIISLVLLTRFAAITEVRHRVERLSKTIEQLEGQKEHLRIQSEKVSNSRWIEKEAKERLNMDYPLTEQINYINVNPVEVALITNELEKIFSASQKTSDVKSITQRIMGKISISWLN